MAAQLDNDRIRFTLTDGKQWSVYRKGSDLARYVAEAYKLTSEYAENKDKVKLEEKVLAGYSAGNIEVYGADAPFRMPRCGSLFWDYIKQNDYDAGAAIAAYQGHFEGWQLPTESLAAALKLTDEYKLYKDKVKNMPGEKKEEKKQYRFAEGASQITVGKIGSVRSLADTHLTDSGGSLDKVADIYYACSKELQQRCSAAWFRALWYRKIVKAGWLKGLEEGKDYTVSPDMKFGPELDKSFGPYLIWNTEDGRKIPLDQLDFIHGHNICKKFEKDIDAAWEYTAKTSPVGTFNGFRDASLYAIERKTRRILAGLEAIEAEKEQKQPSPPKKAKYPCREMSEKGYLCSEEKGHKGPHVARTGEGRTCDTWEDNADAKDARFPGENKPGDDGKHKPGAGDVEAGDGKGPQPEAPLDWQVYKPEWWPYSVEPADVKAPPGYRLGPFRKPTRDEVFIPTGSSYPTPMSCNKDEWSSPRVVLYEE